VWQLWREIDVEAWSPLVMGRWDGDCPQYCGPVTVACFERLEHLTKHSHFRKPEFYYWWPSKSEAVDTAMLFPRSVSTRIVGPQEFADAGFVREPVRGKLTALDP
jgi:hypothetical protein